MAYLANDLILAVMAVLLIFFLAKKDWMKAISISAFAYCCAPVLKLQNGGINSAYLFTFILGIWIIILFVKKSIIWSRKLTLFFIGNIISIAVVGVSWLLNGQCELAHLIHFAGMGQWMLGVIALYVICPDLGKFSKAFYTGIKISIVWNFFVTIVQMFVPQIGLSMTRLLYTYQGKDASIIFMEKEGRFLRAFGTFYSSTETGGFALLAIVLMLVAVYERKKWKQELPFLFMILFVGLFAFSKAVILGVFIVFVLLNIFFYLMKLRLELKKIIVCFSLIIFSFFSVAIIGKSNGLSGQVDYYFGKILNPISAFETRYGDLDNSDVSAGVSSSSEEVREEGNLEKTIEVIKANPVIGVGPASVSGEFVGDSQFVVSLHDGGIVNFLVCLGIYTSLFIISWKNKNAAICIIIAVIAMECVFIPVLSCSYAIPFVAYCLTANIRKDSEKNEKVYSNLL